MPLVKLQKTGKQSAWALWFISESEGELSEACGETCPPEVINPSKRLEWLAGRSILKSLVENSGMEYHGIFKDDNGKPFLEKWPHGISLSHSYPYVAAQLDASRPVGIDLEQPKDKLLKVAHRVLNDSEQADAGDHVVKHCIYWCAKEALFKIYGKKGIFFSSHLAVEAFSLGSFGELKGKILQENVVHEVMLGYTVQPEYVLVYTK
jgi:4'-phosphopantetheinyl transferase EntD